MPARGRLPTDSRGSRKHAAGSAGAHISVLQLLILHALHSPRSRVQARLRRLTVNGDTAQPCCHDEGHQSQDSALSPWTNRLGEAAGQSLTARDEDDTSRVGMARLWAGQRSDEACKRPGGPGGRAAPTTLPSMAGGGLGQGQHTHLFMSPGLTGEGLGSTPFFFPSSLFPEPEKA